MIEIRPIREAEAIPFLKLHCHVFNLDYARSSTVFFDEPLFDLRRKWALFDRGEMTSILTTVPLQFGWGRGVGVAGVATSPGRQGEGLAGLLLQHVLNQAEREGEGNAWLFARDPSLYLRVGFEPIDVVIRAGVKCRTHGTLPALDVREVRHIYERWATKDASRLIRDDRRWSYWQWNLKVCTPFANGYICSEGKQVRECLPFQPGSEWRFPEGAEWLGLQSMASHLELPLVDAQFELHLMGRNAPGIPQMFMTDQF